MMITRRYKDGDAEILWKIYRDTTHLINGRDYTPEQCERWAPADYDEIAWRTRLEKTRPFVAEDDGVVLGFAELEPDGHIGYFYCRHDRQRTGIGRRLYLELERASLADAINRLYAR